MDGRGPRHDDLPTATAELQSASAAMTRALFDSADQREPAEPGIEAASLPGRTARIGLASSERLPQWYGRYLETQAYPAS